MAVDTSGLNSTRNTSTPEYIELANRRFEETTKTGAGPDDALFHNTNCEVELNGRLGGIFGAGG